MATGSSKKKSKKRKSVWKPSKEQANKLVYACVDALLSGERAPSICVALNSDVGLPKGFPRGIAVERNKVRIVRKILAFKILDWLHENGYTTFSSQQVRRTNWGMNMKIGKFLRNGEASDSLEDELQQTEEQ